MKTKRVLTFALGLVLLLASSACKRNDVGTPSPVGPSSFAVLLKLSASRNVIYAGGQRDGSTISVSLKRFDGTPLAGRTIYFEICDSAHLRVDIGYFEGMERVISRQTDGGGNITLVYNGPLDSEIEASTSVYIWATAASEGNEFIEDFAQVNIVRDSLSPGVLEISADPNVIFAGDHREGSTISVSLKQPDGTPLAGRTVYFEICDSAHLRVDIGFFEGMKKVISRQTDSGGNITLGYLGPLNSEIEANTSVYIWATAASEGDEFIEGFAQINIIRDSSSAGVLEISAEPNVIFAGGAGHREKSEISVSLKRPDGTPLVDKTVFFEICDSAHVKVHIGFFEGGDEVLSRQTDAGGNVSIIYHGPIRSELKASTSVYIWATVSSEGDEFTEGFAQVKIISDRD